MRVRKPTRCQRLEADLTQLSADLQDCRQLNEILRASEAQWKTQAQARLDTTMLDSRVKLANALGQMVFSMNDAIKMVIGKEVM